MVPNGRESNECKCIMMERAVCIGNQAYFTVSSAYSHPSLLYFLSVLLLASKPDDYEAPEDRHPGLAPSDFSLTEQGSATFPKY